MFAMRQIMLGRGGAKFKLLPWIRAASYQNRIPTPFVFKPLQMYVVFGYGIGSTATGYNISSLFSVSAANISASQLTGGGKAFGVVLRDYSNLMIVLGESSRNTYAEAFRQGVIQTTGNDPYFNTIKMTYNAKWLPSVEINGATCTPSSYSGSNTSLKTTYAEHGLVFFAHRNANGNIVNMSPNSDWTIPNYFLSYFDIHNLSTGEKIASFRPAMDNSNQSIGMLDSVSGEFYAAENGTPLHG